MEAVTGFLFLGSKITRDCSHEIKMLAPWKESYDSRLIKKQRHHSADKSLYSQSYDFHSSHVQMWELAQKEDWALKNWCFQIVLGKTLENPFDSKESKSVNPKGSQPWIFTGRTDAETETPTLWSLDANSWPIGKDPDTRKDDGIDHRWKEKGVTEDEMVR